MRSDLYFVMNLYLVFFKRWFNKNIFKSKHYKLILSSYDYQAEAKKFWTKYTVFILNKQ